MSNRHKARRISDLVKSDLFGVNMLRMLHSTIDKRILRDLELTENVPQVGENFADSLRFACKLQVIHVSCH